MARVVMFGTDRHAHIWGLRNGVDRKNIMLATNPNVVEFIRGEKQLTVVRVTDDQWKPTTLPDEKRVRESDRAINVRLSQGVTVTEKRLS